MPWRTYRVNAAVAADLWPQNDAYPRADGQATIFIHWVLCFNNQIKYMSYYVSIFLAQHSRAGTEWFRSITRPDYADWVKDGMDQSKWSIPRCRGDRYSKTFEQLERPRIKVHGLWCHYRELMFFCADPRTAADSDFIIECAARGLERIAAQCRESGAPMPTEVTIWCDNTVRESKNTWVLTFLSALVLKMKMKFAALCMSMVGHTHGCLDQIYGQLTVCFRYCSVLLDCDDVCSRLWTF